MMGLILLNDSKQGLIMMFVQVIKYCHKLWILISVSQKIQMSLFLLYVSLTELSEDSVTSDVEGS